MRRRSCRGGTSIWHLTVVLEATLPGIFTCFFFKRKELEKINGHEKDSAGNKGFPKQWWGYMIGWQRDSKHFCDFVGRFQTTEPADDQKS